MDPMSLDLLTQNADIRFRKLLGRSFLRENRLEEAIDVYLGILRDFPSDSDCLVILANLYRISGCPTTAEHLYSRALEHNLDNKALKDLIAQVHEEAGCIEEEVAPFDPAAVSRLVARLLAMTGQDSHPLEQKRKLEDIRGAADMLDRMIAEEPREVPLSSSQGREGLQQLMPALLEINIRQARASGRPELAEALQSFQLHLTRQVTASGDGT